MSMSMSMFNGAQIPSNNYHKVWTYVVYDNSSEEILPILVEGHEIFTVRDIEAEYSWLAHELSLAEADSHNHALAILMSLGRRDGAGCDPSQVGIDGGIPGSDCPTGQRCRATGRDLHQCRRYKGVYLGRALLKFNPDGSLQEDPWQQVPPIALLTRNLQMYYDQDQTIVSWIEDDGIHPARINISEFSLDQLLCQDGEGPCSPVNQVAADLDSDGVSSPFDCDDENEDIGHFDAAWKFMCTLYKYL